MLAAFEYAGDEELPVVSASFATDPLLPTVEKEAVDVAFTTVFADNPGTLYVVAAGNEGNDNDDELVYPCSNAAENLICVGMTDVADKPVCWGNVGEGVGRRVRARDQGVLDRARRRGLCAARGHVRGDATGRRRRRAAGEPGPALNGPLELKAALLNNVDYVPGLDAWSSSDGRLNAARPLDPRPPDFGVGGPGGPWVSCDTDHAGFHETGDKCPDVVGPANGCPDGDRDGIRDLDDNCRTLANADQTDVDADRVGDACDATPRGEDVDGDAKAALDDLCPTQPAPTADGCPVIVEVPPGATPQPTPTPPPPPPPVNDATESSRSTSPSAARAGIRAGRRRRSRCASRAPLASR